MVNANAMLARRWFLLLLPLLLAVCATVARAQLAQFPSARADDRHRERSA